MTLVALGLVLFAAVLHASWNAMLKSVTDRAGVLAAISGMHALAGLVLIASSPVPDMASWPSILVSTLVHYLYYILLFQSYRHGDLSQVYPISRGVAPALVALGAYLLIDESLTPQGWAGLTAVCAGIALLALQRGVTRAPRSAILFALAVGACIATYSVADGIGVRAAGTTTGYIGWLFVLEAPVLFTIALLRRRDGGRFERRTLLMGMLGGACAVTAYAVVLYVKTFAPLGAVSAVRESSVIFAALIGVVLFRERPWKGRLLAAAIVAGGVVALAS